MRKIGTRIRFACFVARSRRSVDWCTCSLCCVRPVRQVPRRLVQPRVETSIIEVSVFKSEMIFVCGPSAGIHGIHCGHSHVLLLLCLFHVRLPHGGERFQLWQVLVAVCLMVPPMEDVDFPLGLCPYDISRCRGQVNRYITHALWEGDIPRDLRSSRWTFRSHGRMIRAVAGYCLCCIVYDSSIW